VLLALLAGAILLSLVAPWGQRISRRLRASLAWLGFAVMASIGLLRLAATLAEVIAGDPFGLLTPAIYIYVYTCFSVLGVTFAITAWRTQARSSPGFNAPAAHSPKPDSPDASPEDR